MIERPATVRNGQGIHCRPSAKIVTEASLHLSEIRVIATTGEADLKSLLSLVSLGLQEGATVRIQVTGGDEQTICDRIVELFETQFDFPPLSTDGRNMMMNSLACD
jgi:phosphotransferase system HPr (HPr) family protein